VKTVWLEKGSHRNREEGVCAMELAAWLAGEGHTYSPECVSAPLRNLMIWINDSLAPEARQRLKPYVSRTLGTAGDGQDEERRVRIGQWLESAGMYGWTAAEGHTYLRTHPEECFALIESILDPAGIHDVKVDAEMLAAQETAYA
jgi:hypothetical protein